MQASDKNLNLPTDPLDGLMQWLKDADMSGQAEPTAMTLSTVADFGRPRARIVLFKGLSVNAKGERGPRFFTNYRSAKSREMEKNPYVSLVFHWVKLERQLRIEGRVEKVSREESEEYFASRPRGSQVGAWASPQSETIQDRAFLDRSVADIEARFQGQEIECPPHWGGWRVIPDRVEFWQGISHRLHDRFVFELKNGAWVISRLAP